MAPAQVARCACVAAVVLLLGAAAAQAAPVAVLTEDGHVRPAQDRFLGAGADMTPRRSRPADPPRATVARSRTVISVLKRLRASGALDPDQYASRREAYEAARSTARRLSGTRGAELGAVVRAVESIAARGQLAASRVVPLWLTLERNREWWTTGSLIPGGRRVEFEGSELVWQYYPGQGLQLQVLANFGKLNALWSGKRYDERMGAMLDELLPLAAHRGGGLAWEYYFSFDGGRPPWVSGMAQGTALQAIARAATRLGRRDELLPIAARGLRLFHQRPPTGVRVEEGDGAHYLLYSFAPRLRVLNGFLQSLIGLQDYAAIAGDADAQALFASGERLALRETPRFDTGAWSLYSRGSVERESDLSYHDLLGEFLGGLCKRTGQAPFCTAQAHLEAYKAQPPTLALRSRRLRGGEEGPLRFSLSKISNVGVALSRGGEVVLSRPPVLVGHGRAHLDLDVPRRAGTYAVRLTAVDLAGNAGSVEGTVEVLPRRRHRN